MRPSSKKFTKKINLLEKGKDLLVLFLINLNFEIIITALFVFAWDLRETKAVIVHIVIAIIIENIIFFAGIIMVYLSSVQLGIKWRVIGVLCGWIPGANLWALIKIIKITASEVIFEKEKQLINSSRAESFICQTKYPILLVHGVFFRDFALLNYWGRIPSHLIKNGAKIYYGEHESAASIEESGKELAEKIKSIVEKTGCEKLNIIAHSKGGLDCRYAISHAGANMFTASLTTVNTPHNGCLFADYLLDKIPAKTQRSIARKYNSASKLIGDKNPDFINAVKGLTSETCCKFNKSTPDAEGIFYQSIGSKMNKAKSGKFPLNIMYPFVKHFDGENDGLVSLASMKYGESFTQLEAKEGRGISHGDIIDLNRENITGFDVREFYAELIQELKARGL